jgi:VanZ family protein
MKFKPFLPALAWLVIITWLSVNSGMPMPKFNLFSADKLFHAAAYALLTALLLWGRSKSGPLPIPRSHQTLIFLLATGYGAFMEWIQGTFFPNRSFEYDDMIANTAGVFLAIMIFRLVKPHNP